MYNTPLKNQRGRQLSLRERIQNKLQTEKKKFNTKQNIIQKYYTKSKNQDDEEMVNKNKLNFKSVNKQLIQKEQFLQGSQSEKQNQSVEQIITETKVLEFQSTENKNFFGYPEWLKFNNSLFNHVDQDTVKNLWKIMRIINYGHSLIPTGLIYQISKVLINEKNTQQTIKKNKSSRNLQFVLNEFLSLNNVSDQVINFREIKMYPSLEKIQQNYCIKKPCIQVVNNFQRNFKSYSSSKNISQKKKVFDRIYNDSKRRFQTKNQSIYKSLLQKADQCTFKPQIYRKDHTKSLFYDQVTRPERICHERQKWKTKIDLQNIFPFQNNFKATEFDRSIYETANLENIPGVTDHIKRKKYSEAEKLRLQRFKEKPSQSYKKY